MPFNTVGLLVDLYRKFKAPTSKKTARKSRRGASLRRLRLEPDNAIIALRPPHPGASGRMGCWSTGGKIFGTQSVALDYFFFEATCEDGDRMGGRP